MLYKLAAGRLPFCTAAEEYKIERQNELLKYIQRDFDFESYPFTSFSEISKDFLRGLLQKDERTRFNVTQTRNHPFLEPKTEDPFVADETFAEIVVF